MANIYFFIRKLKKLSFFLLLFLSIVWSSEAQTISTGLSPSTSAGNNYGITFVVENTNPGAIILTDVADYIDGGYSNSTWTLYYSSTSLSGTPALSFPDPNWTSIASNTLGNISTTGIQTVISGMTFMIPGNTMYRFSLVTTGNRQYFSGTATNTYSAGGVNLYVGNYQISGQNVGYGGPNNPRYLCGSITVMPASPCNGAPTAGAASIASSSVCPNQSFNVFLSGATLATGLTYDWQYDDGSGWQSTGGINANYTSTMTAIASVDYRCIVSCGSLSDTSTPVTVSPGSFYTCYCSPLNGTPLASSYGDNFITSVEIPTTTLNNPTSSGNGNGYSQFSASTPSNTATLYPGISYTINVGKMYTNDYAGAWIDFDGDGTMNNATGTDEFIPLITSSGNTTGSFTVPLTATPGLTGLRVRVNDWGNVYGPGDTGPCDDDFYGETEDYTITIGTLTNCNGQPNAATITSSTGTSVCPSIDFTLIAANMSIGMGISYDWQYDDGSGWMSMGGMSNIYTVTGGIIMPTSYRMITYCATSSQFDTSNVIAVAVNPFYSCYCSPLNGTTLSQYGNFNAVTGVAIPTTSLNNPTSSNNPIGYELFDPSTSSNTATLWPGITYTINVDLQYPQWDDAGVWIDWDGDGTMNNATGTDENVVMTGTSTGATGTFMVPLTATAGMTGLRVRSNDYGWTYGPGDTGPCDDDEYGETEDYIVTIATLTNCNGQPAATTISGPAGNAICPSIDFTLTATNMTVGLGVTYDWQYDDGSGWISTGGTNTTYTAIGGIIMPTSYRMITYCGVSNLYDTSNVLAIAVNPFYNCYCSPLNGTTLSQYGNFNAVTGVEIPTTSLNNPTSSNNPIGYELFDPSTSSNTATLWPGITYTINVDLQYPQYDDAGVWIDWDGDGTMNNATGTDENVVMTGTSTGATGTFTVPFTATAGMTGLRVRSNDYGWTYGPGDTGPCDDDEYGETEDYVVTIATLTNCNGQPAATTISGPAGNAICPNIDFTLTATNMTVGLGVTYDWQYNDGSGWVSTGIASTTYAATGGIIVPTSYRMITYCSFSSQYDTSNVIAMAINSFYACYCSPLNGTDLASSYGDNFITSVAIPSTTLNNSASSYNSNGYMQFYPSTTTTTGDLLQGVTYTLNVGMLYPQWDYAGAWIDWDGDGTFSNATGTDEFIPLTVSSSGATGSFLVPLTATLGITGLRVRVNDWGNIYGPGDTGPCDDDLYGETEDYVINVLPAPSCLPPSAPSATAITATSADIGFTAAATQYEIEYAPGSSFTVGTGTRIPATSNPATISPLSPSTQYSYYVRAICGPNDTSIWTAGAPFYTLCAPVTTYPWSYDVESQPGNTGSGQFIGCWAATPVPSGSTYEWNVTSNGSTPSSLTGPTTAHSGTRYFYTEASNGPWNGAIASLTSPQYDITGLVTPALEFYYHMYGAAINKLVIEVYNGATWDRVDSLVGQQQTSETAPWLLKSISLAAYTGNIQVRFTATEGIDYTGDISIDDIVITTSPTVIKLDKLTATNVGSSNRVEWNTFAEERSDKFELQRSADGKQFATIYNKDANGEPSRYTYMDNDPVKGYNYYRLRMTEVNGNAAYSEVVKAFVKSTGFEVDAYPNPVSHDLTVKVSGIQGTDATILVTDVTGKVINTIKMAGNVEQINMSGLANGIYLIKYSDANHTQTIKVNKQ